MLPHKALIGCLMLTLVSAGCSRLTFVRPKGGIKEYKAVDAQYSVSDSKATRRRLEERDSLGLAEQRLRVGDLDSAEAEASRALKLNPQSPGAHTMLAIIDDRLGKAREAGEHYRQAAELAPRDSATLNNYGVWLCSNGLAAEGLVWLDRAIANSAPEGTAGALANAGGCALTTGQYERVEPDLRKALTLDPGNAYALVSMARNKYRLGQYMDARAFIERRLTAAPVDAGVLQLAADIETKLGDKAGAEKYRQRQRAEFPDAAAANAGDSAKP